ncbi:hypothetical protein ANCDUO_08631 [Ancylostoma duodenale]|uniref:Uncharacterized protein n=1 Tax=Ancylostoma duodenale TaxID=51022 RepID=A0A0C2GPV0_9BILA|nr:hypothetical protein ANCDUO_08631 [Ancylostoma duodenale]
MDEGTRQKNMKTIAAFLVQEHAVAIVKAGRARKITSGSYITIVYVWSNLFSQPLTNLTTVPKVMLCPKSRALPPILSGCEVPLRGERPLPVHLPEKHARCRLLHMGIGCLVGSVERTRMA